ncbi:MAG: hypothetical protein OEZ65_10310 [Gemmatimonadota bacterium]|nr:hypothetical protein [Gemmatimonadota bacterium]
MITMYLLGGARLEGEGGRLHGEPVQRHRVALLAVLALARDARLPREKILALLWPEQEPRRARHLLNVSVHVLRKALGKEAILSEGDDLRLDLDLVVCDAAAFRDAAARGDAKGAIERYAGPFMDGFFLDEAPEFDQWQGARRRELEDDYVTALATRADEAGEIGDLAEATECVRRIVRTRPMDAPATVRLMKLHEARGDIADALNAASDHARAMVEAFDAEPNPEVARLAERMREAPRPAQVDEEAPRAVSVPALPRQLQAPSQFQAPSPARPRSRHILAVAAVVVAVAVAAVARATDPEPAVPIYEASVAVLPFMDMSADGDQAYLSDGLTEELLNALAQMPGLMVAARSSSFQFRGDGIDVRSVGRRLGVASVVEGSVRVDGDRLRVTTQLIDAESGYHLWSEQYDRDMRDVFAVQEEIARAVATALNSELVRQLPDALVPATTTNPAAYHLYLRGRYEWRKRTEEGMKAALEAFQEAVLLDPTYAAAYAGLADTWQLLPDYAGIPSSEGLARAKTAALRAVALDSSSAEAHVALAALLDDYDRDRRGAEAAYRRAIELNPGYATARHWLAIHLADDGRFAEALEQIEHARRLDPLSSIVNTAVGAVRYFERDYDGAAAEYQSVLDLQPYFALGWALLGRVQLVDGRVGEAVSSLWRSVELSGGDPSYRAVYAAALAEAGRTAEAHSIAEEVRNPEPGGYVPYCELASAYLYLGDDAQALALFELAYGEHDPALKHIGVEPLYDGIREDPRFVDLMRRSGFEAIPDVH